MLPVLVLTVKNVPHIAVVSYDSYSLQALSTTEEEDVWTEQDFFIDPNHYEDVFAKMMQGESVALLLKEFFEVVIQ